MNDDESLLCHVNYANGFRGGERQTFLLIKSLANKGFHQKLIVRKGSELGRYCQSIDGVEVIQSVLFGFDALFKIPSKAFFHFHDSRTFPSLYLHNHIRDINYIYTRRVQRPPNSNFMTKMIYGKAKNIVCLSDSITFSVKKSLNDNFDFKIIPSASANFESSIENSEIIRKKLRQQFIVGHIGVLDDSHKGQFEILKLAKEVKEHSLDIGFMIVGSGKDEEELINKSKGLDNIYLAGQVENIGDYLNAFDVFIFPSRHEGLGSTLLDALDFGIPIIASDVGGIPEIIEDKVNGFLIDPNKPEFFKALLELFNDVDKRKQITEANKSKAREFSIERMTNSYINLYNQYL